MFILASSRINKQTAGAKPSSQVHGRVALAAARPAARRHRRSRLHELLLLAGLGGAALHVLLKGLAGRNIRLLGLGVAGIEDRGLGVAGVALGICGRTCGSDANSNQNKLESAPSDKSFKSLAHELSSVKPTLYQTIVKHPTRCKLSHTDRGSPVPQPESRCPPSCFTSQGFTAAAPAPPICTDVRACAAATAPDKADCAVL